MKELTHKSISSFCFILLFPLLLGCSTFGGSQVSDDPAIVTQQQEVDQLKKEVREAERLSEEARQREKAAKDRLNAAEHELKALEERAKRRSEY
ncbi:hypothetical protein H9Q13_01165 [Pontibacter sp. JH31]|uniref:Uncharacterized protein n=1 Tax=Pontibacter aquaedesilientis TaxID=2766980 RepID=A0ABR7XCZ3_9BACT|nr:hypothetical protein [Pontibacter aquaedesilientis]MBD1395761.1 hypothetical protein [Pontibacter aquaedesilientis]